VSDCDIKVNNVLTFVYIFRLFFVCLCLICSVEKKFNFFGYHITYFSNEFVYLSLDLMALSCNERLELLESLLSDPDGDKKLNQSLNLEDNFKGHQFSMDALLDTFILLFDECSNSSLRREKSVSDFLKLGKLKFNIKIIYKFKTIFKTFSKTLCSHCKKASANA